MHANSGNTREKILEAAIKLFSEKGFNGTRVNEIAKEAAISQALIYYNFKSKDEILQEILNRFKKDLIDTFKRIYSKEEYSPYYGHWEPEEVKAGMDFFVENRRLWIVLLLESLKSSTGKDNLIFIWDTLNKNIREVLLEKRGFSLKEGDLKRDMVDLFFIFIPAIFFSIFSDEWRRLRNFNYDESQKSFASILNVIYTQFLKMGKE